MILAHKPSLGPVEPAEADLVLTRKLKEALALVDVLDYFVVRSKTCFKTPAKNSV